MLKILYWPVAILLTLLSFLFSCFYLVYCFLFSPEKQLISAQDNPDYVDDDIINLLNAA